MKIDLKIRKIIKFLFAKLIVILIKICYHNFIINFQIFGENLKINSFLFHYFCSLKYFFAFIHIFFYDQKYYLLTFF